VSLLEAISPTAAELLELQFYSVRYTWADPVLGELHGATCVTGVDEEAALASFRSKHPHLTSATLIH
jgi:hypothetical protein